MAGTICCQPNSIDLTCQKNKNYSPNLTVGECIQKKKKQTKKIARNDSIAWHGKRTNSTLHSGQPWLDCIDSKRVKDTTGKLERQEEKS